MDIIVVSHKGGRTRRLTLDRRHILGWLPIVLLVSMTVSGAFYVGYWARALSTPTATASALPASLLAKWTAEVRAQRTALDNARSRAEEDDAALARRIAQVQAHVMRLDAAGQRLTEIAGLDQGEFDFEQPPALGGPESASSDADFGLGSALDSLDRLEQQLSDRERQFKVLEDLLLASRLQKEVRPSGWPIEGGWISSLFGVRTDPFTGRRTRHLGIDFAGRAGSAVFAVAAGIVTAAGPHSGYGNLVEINHGNGYTTRYGHNSKVLVKVGDRISKGQKIALMGSTGRSTGPHVHLEVRYNGVAVNPEQYIRAAR